MGAALVFIYIYSVYFSSKLVKYHRTSLFYDLFMFFSSSLVSFFVSGSNGRKVALSSRSKCFNHILFTNPSARAGYDTKSIFKRSLTGFNSEFSFS